MGTRSSVAIIKNDQLLMVRQLYKGEEIWTFPGGSIEEGETPEHAAIREV
ncbi:NUDIX domain-containing protein [Paenibacillus radicis (ex Xue et al. 2023)]|uniref:NUDIX domain-containing protein n=1 Tax=Paenibacillus radicis (ex Xue et al. 2023) TaxID=2972489 RepID=A0ABT1YIS7_9BACL|nr:NUDIX domain-containing protein [Paenibacillus radicis (ex Xue et al. 2023)]MCR8633076.1 NUDIX domain-containing protein [Paenibacillus radicis (ex Xue et al. 2023)]